MNAQDKIDLYAAIENYKELRTYSQAIEDQLKISLELNSKLVEKMNILSDALSKISGVYLRSPEARSVAREALVKAEIE